MNKLCKGGPASMDSCSCDWKDSNGPNNKGKCPCTNCLVKTMCYEICQDWEDQSYKIKVTHE